MVTNYDMQYFLQKEVFQTSLDGFRDFSSEVFKNVNLTVQNYVRTGLLISARAPEFNATLLMVPRLKIKLMTPSYNNSRYQLKFVQVVRCVGDCSHV